MPMTFLLFMLHLGGVVALKCSVTTFTVSPHRPPLDTATVVQRRAGVKAVCYTYVFVTFLAGGRSLVEKLGACSKTSSREVTDREHHLISLLQCFQPNTWRKSIAWKSYSACVDVQRMR